MFDDNKTLPPLRVPIAPEMDATMAGRRVLDPVAEPADIDATMPGKRDRKPDGMFDIGDLIMNRYKVLSKLGQGGMGVVYKCFDETAGVEIALKALPPELSHNTLEMEDIRRNFQIVHNLHHPNIASYNNLECDPANGYYYLIMECCAGEDLRRWIRYRHESGTLNFIEVISIIQQVAIALDYAHSMKIIHRDIKPGNIMIDQLGKVKVLDFGLAAQIHTSMTRVSMVYHGTSGTGPYMAPEQWRGRLQDVRADQYALAVMTYEMLAGHLPFESSDVTVLREAVLNEKPAPIRNIPDFAQKAIDRAMSKDPVQRFATCGEFVAALSKAPVKPALFRKRILPLAHGVALVIAALLAWFIFFGKEKTVQPIPPPPPPKSEIAALIIDANNAKESKNWDEYYRLLLKILELDASNKEAQTSLGWCYYWGKGVKQDYAEAVKWWRKAAEQGYANAQFNLGLCYAEGKGVKQDYAEAVKWFRKAAEQGNAGAQNNLGVCYEKGKGVKQDSAEAAKWYLKAAEQGDADAQFNLGVCYEKGEGVKQDFAEAVKWYRKAAEQGYAYAQTNLGVCYDNGYGVKQDSAEAVKWYRKAADQGFAGAQNNLGVCYYFGNVVKQDYAEAVKWYRKAAEQGDAEAQYFLGGCYAEGKGVKQDSAEAVKWLRKAAEQGVAQAQNNLGWCYEKGYGVKQDHTEAAKWYRKAAEQGDADAAEALKKLQK